VADDGMIRLRAHLKTMRAKEQRGSTPTCELVLVADVNQTTIDLQALTGRDFAVRMLVEPLPEA
jgi:hypothetical protein